MVWVMYYSVWLIFGDGDLAGSDPSDEVVLGPGEWNIEIYGN